MELEATPAGAVESEPTPSEERLDPRVVPYWTVANLIGALVLGAITAIGATWLRSEFPERAAWIAAAAWAVGVLLLLSVVAQPMLAYATWRYGIDRELLVARYGILFRDEKAIPISRLQHVDLRRGPIERLFGLATLVVFTAGTEGATFRVPGLAAELARALRDRILAARGDDVI
jgi:membrane protein YdbS with pleckstrin-like domain